jgi:hypothetical protein
MAKRTRAPVAAYACCAALAFAACKVRDPDAGGLLDDTEADADPTAAEEKVADGGRFAIDCRVLEGKGHYFVEVSGAVRADDEAQPLYVHVERRDGSAAPRILAGREAGRGRVTVQGSLFIGFQSGALTAEPAREGDGTHLGVLSLADDPEAVGAAVRCKVVPAS